MTEAITWYLALVLVGAAGLLPAALLCERMPTRGVLYARPLALAVLALAAWLIGWSGMLPYGGGAILLALAGLVVWSGAIAWRRPDLLARLWERRTWIVAGEVVLLAVFVLVTLARVQAPDAVNTEKPMDLMLLVAVHGAETMPPPDPWLAGESLSYYHLGQVSLDVVARLSGNGPGEAFNLGVAMAGALAAVAVLGLIGDLLGERVRRRTLWIGGATGLVVLLLLAPIVGLVQLLAANGIGGENAWGWLNVDGVPEAESTRWLVPDTYWWWWNSTRVLPDTITEFPAFALLLGDPHAHVIAMPLVVIVLALAVEVARGDAPLTWRRWLMPADRLVLTAAVFAALVMTNAWDLITLGPIWGLAGVFAIMRTGWDPWQALMVAVRWAALPAGLAVLLALPYLTSLDTPPLGVAPVVGEHSDPLRWLLVWLAPLLPVVVGLAWLGTRPSRGMAAAAMLGFVAVGIAWEMAGWAVDGAGAISERGSGWIVIAGLVAGATYTLWPALRVDPDTRPGDRRDVETERGIRVLLGVALVILLALEVVRIDDAFAGRMNTVFKFGFQAWLMLAVAGGALLGWSLDRRLRRDAAGAREPAGAPERSSAGGMILPAVGGLLAMVLLALSLYTPATAISRAWEGQERRVDAMAFLHDRQPGIAAVAAWSREHLDPAEHVVAQTVGESYTEGNLLATHSGIPAPLAWPNHQRQWRGEIEEQGRRMAVDAIYAGEGLAAQGAIARWKVTHVLIGPDEHAAYGSGLEGRFATWPVAVEAGGVRLLEVPPGFDADDIRGGGASAP